jgi:hypothetical protein
MINLGTGCSCPGVESLLFVMSPWQVQAYLDGDGGAGGNNGERGEPLPNAVFPPPEQRHPR